MVIKQKSYAKGGTYKEQKAAEYKAKYGSTAQVGVGRNTGSSSSGISSKPTPTLSSTDKQQLQGMLNKGVSVEDASNTIYQKNLYKQIWGIPTPTPPTANSILNNNPNIMGRPTSNMPSVFNSPKLQSNSNITSNQQTQTTPLILYASSAQKPYVGESTINKIQSLPKISYKREQVLTPLNYKTGEKFNVNIQKGLQYVDRAKQENIKLSQKPGLAGLQGTLGKSSLDYLGAGGTLLGGAALGVASVPGFLYNLVTSPSRTIKQTVTSTGPLAKTVLTNPESTTGTMSIGQLWGAGKGFNILGKVSPIKFRSVDIPVKPKMVPEIQTIGTFEKGLLKSYKDVETGKMVPEAQTQNIYKGTVLKIGSKEYPMLGKTAQGIKPGTPEINLKNIYLENGYIPETVTGTKIIGKNIESTGLSKLQGELLYGKGGAIEILQKTNNVKSKFIVNQFKKETETLTPSGVDVVLEAAKKSDSTVYGSFGQKAQTPTYLWEKYRGKTKPADIDIQTKLSGPDTEIFAENLVKSLKSKGENVRISSQSPTLIEKKVGGNWRHAVDIHSIDNLEGGTPSGLAFGFKMTQEPIKIGGVKTQALSEQGVRKAASTFTLRQITGDYLKTFKEQGYKTKIAEGDIKLMPEAHRIKDVGDFFGTQETLAISKNVGSSKLLKTIENLKTKFPKEYFKDTNVKTVELFKPSDTIKTSMAESAMNNIIKPSGVGSIISGSVKLKPSPTIYGPNPSVSSLFNQDIPSPFKYIKPSKTSRPSPSPPSPPSIFSSSIYGPSPSKPSPPSPYDYYPTSISPGSPSPSSPYSPYDYYPTSISPGSPSPSSPYSPSPYIPSLPIYIPPISGYINYGNKKKNKGMLKEWNIFNPIKEFGKIGNKNINSFFKTGKKTKWQI